MSHEVLLVYDETMLGHNPTGWDPGHPEWADAIKALMAEQYPDKDFPDFSHPERPQRLSAIIEKLRNEPVPGTRWVAADTAEPPELKRVHTKKHVRFIEALIGRSCWLSIDTTAVSPQSVMAAKYAAGAGVTAVEAIGKGAAKRAFCAVRPPGHHAPAERAMGFCLYNNVAVAAAHARSLGMEKILIWDWDLHHGNGTQDIFYRDPNVVFIDSHCAAPFYPGSGMLEEIGQGAGKGFNFNVPLPAGSGNAALMAVADKVVGPVADAFQPDLILISAGYDGHHFDQTFYMDETGFAALTEKVCAIAERTAQGRVVVCLEGGYNADSLALSAHATVQALTGVEADLVNVVDDDPGLAAVEQAAAFHAKRIGKLADASTTLGD